MSSILPLITEIVNDSLSSGHVPEELKVAHVTSLLKNTSLDKNVLKNYRLVSNLPFVSKVLERAVAKQLQNNLTVNNLHEPQQSAYRKHHSTVTALLCVQNDIVQAINGKKIVILVLLDLSAAFDTIDHTVLLHRLKHDFGITGTALKWLDSYLSHRTQTVKIGDSFSTKQKLLFGVPQGSVLGPVLFSLYSSPEAKIARKYGLCVQLYADDTQLTSHSRLVNGEKRSKGSRNALKRSRHGWWQINFNHMGIKPRLFWRVPHVLILGSLIWFMSKLMGILYHSVLLLKILA